MPTYTMRCEGCGDLVEHFMTFKEYDCHGSAVPHVCPNTGQTEILRPAIVEAPPVHYKGYGFYRTDSRSADASYDWDHFDGSGTNPEINQLNRRIKNPHKEHENATS